MVKFDIRQAQPGDEKAIAAVQIRAWEETYRNILPEPLITPWQHDELERIWHRRIRPAQSVATTIVGTDGNGTIAGFGICGNNRSSALPTGSEISLLYILRQYHSCGLGRGLMRSLATAANARGHATTGLWVLSANTAAVRFYQALGGIQVVARQGRFGGYTTHELGFIWPTGLLKRSGSLKGANVERK